MDKLILSNQDVLDLLAWREEHKDEVRSGVMPVKEIEIHCTAVKIIIKCFRDGRKLKIHANVEGRSRGYIMFDLRDDGFWVQKKTTSDLDKENIQACLTLYCTVMAVMAFASPVVHTDETDRKPTTNKPKASTAKPKPKNAGVTYIIHRTKNGPMALPKGHHASPAGIFSVRGHFRHYKNGRVVWIEQYKKGTGNKKKRKYKIGKDALSKDGGDNGV